MWMIVLLLCSNHIKEAKCTALTAKMHAEVHGIYGLKEEPNSCDSRLDKLDKRNPRKGYYVVMTCEPDDRI